MAYRGNNARHLKKVLGLESLRVLFYVLGNVTAILSISHLIIYNHSTYRRNAILYQPRRNEKDADRL